MHDLILAVLHHLLFLALIVILAMELTWLRLASPPVKRLAGLDASYGVTAALILIVGAGRVLGGKGWAFYQGNPFFWAKLATFALIGLISIRPTLMILKWRKAARADVAYAPPEAERAAAGRAVACELLLLIPLLGFAAAMARWPF